MAYDNKDKNMESVYSKRVKAGRRRTYFFDVKATKGNDYYLTITESRKRFDGDHFERHKIFVYKEDFNKFVKGLNEAVDYAKTELMPNFDFDAFNHDDEGEYNHNNNNNHTEAAATEQSVAPEPVKEEGPTPAEPQDNGSTEEVDKW